VLIHVVHSNQGPSLLGLFPFSHLNRIKYTTNINSRFKQLKYNYICTIQIYTTANISHQYFHSIFITKVFVFYVMEEERLHILTY
jgi:hypothetical protein